MGSKREGARARVDCVDKAEAPGTVGRGFGDGEVGTPYRPKRGGDTLLRDSAYLANKFAKLR